MGFSGDLKPEVTVYGNTSIPKKDSPYRNERMQNIDILKDCMSHTDDEVFKALCYFDIRKLSESPVAALDKGRHLFAASWRLISKTHKEGNKDFFTLIFGTQRKYSWYSWTTFDQERFSSFVHETERLLRKYLKTGRSLKEKPSEAWVRPYVETVIKADILEEREASRPKVNIRAEDLERIRSDAGVTRDWLLTEDETYSGEEEVRDSDPGCVSETDRGLSPAKGDMPLGLDALHLSIVEALILGETADDIVRENHLMASVAADSINEAFFDEIGDNVLECEDGRLSLVEDYKEDVRGLLGV